MCRPAGAPYGPSTTNQEGSVDTSEHRRTCTLLRSGKWASCCSCGWWGHAQQHVIDARIEHDEHVARAGVPVPVVPHACTATRTNRGWWVAVCTCGWLSAVCSESRDARAEHAEHARHVTLSLV